MRKANKISKDEKLCFVLNYLPVQKQYQKNKKRRNITNIISAIVATVSLIMGLTANIPVAMYTAVLGSMILFPAMYVFNSKMREVIDSVSQTNITYRQFKQMEKSGELETLIKEAHELQTQPAYVGIKKFTPIIVTPTSQTGGRQTTATSDKTKDGRDA